LAAVEVVAQAQPLACLEVQVVVVVATPLAGQELLSKDTPGVLVFILHPITPEAAAAGLVLLAFPQHHLQPMEVTEALAFHLQSQALP